MTAVKVKICGITNWPDARQSCDAGADLLGFNFWPRSSRYIAPAKARRIVSQLPKGIAAVGVFVNETEAKMIEIARAVGLDYLQLHGDESPDAVARLQRIFPVIKAIRVRESFRSSELAQFASAEAILLDGFDRKMPGGTGKAFQWGKACRSRGYGKIFLAGGLTSKNIGEAIRAAKPFAVDACSGVESKPGKKNHASVKAFVLAAKSAQKVRRTRSKKPKR